MSNSDDSYLGALLEEIRDQNKAVLEAVGDIQQKVTVLPAMQKDVAELKQDMRVVKAAVTDLSHQVSGHEHRIGRLETAS